MMALVLTLHFAHRGNNYKLKYLIHMFLNLMDYFIIKSIYRNTLKNVVLKKYIDIITCFRSVYFGHSFLESIPSFWSSILLIYICWIYIVELFLIFLKSDFITIEILYYYYFFILFKQFAEYNNWVNIIYIL